MGPILLDTVAIATDILDPLVPTHTGAYKARKRGRHNNTNMPGSGGGPNSCMRAAPRTRDAAALTLPPLLRPPESGPLPVAVLVAGKAPDTPILP